MEGSMKKKCCCRKKHKEQQQQLLNREQNHHTVVNISNIPLSNNKKDFLSRGLSFFPKPSKIDQFQLEQDIQQFFRRLRLKEFFHKLEGDNDEIPWFRRKSKWTPPCNRDLALETYIKAIKNDIHRALDHDPRNHPHKNLTSWERKALLLLRTPTDITIKPANKGSATVVMSRWDYLVKVMSHLENENFYRRLDEDPTERFAEKITSELYNMTDKHVNNKGIFNYLQPQKRQTSWFYVSPKIHKDGIPGRPIVSLCGAPTEKNSQFVDFNLKPLIAKHHHTLKIPQTSY